VQAHLVDDVGGQLQLREPRLLGERRQLLGGVGRAAVQSFDQDSPRQLDQRPALGRELGVLDLLAQPVDRGGQPAHVAGRLHLPEGIFGAPGHLHGAAPCEANGDAMNAVPDYGTLG
jgi:hypothetical protein